MYSLVNMSLYTCTCVGVCVYVYTCIIMCMNMIVSRMSICAYIVFVCTL